MSTNLGARLEAPISIAFNATATSSQTGIGRYVRELAISLEQQGVNIHYFVGLKWTDVAPQVLGSPGLAKQLARFLVHHVPGAQEWVRKIQQRHFTQGLVKHQPALYHEPNYLAFRFPGLSVVTAHDASWVRYPETHPVSRVRVMDRYFPEALERAQLVIVDSDFVAREMHEIFGVPYARLRAISLGVSSAFQPLSPLLTHPTCQRLGLEHGRYILSVGTLEPRKNLISLIRAYRSMPASLTSRYPLVIGGTQGWRHKDIDREIAALERTGSLRFLGGVAESDLPALFAAATLFVYPSLYEGFGLPPLEAMKSGVPVVVSNCSSLPEVVGDAGKCVNPKDINALAETLRSVLEDQALRQRMAKAGVAHANGFTWEKCAERTIAVYREAMAL
jgi:alpha-1,3-rhamnosyl/mannosyltransferase